MTEQPRTPRLTLKGKIVNSPLYAIVSVLLGLVAFFFAMQATFMWFGGPDEILEASTLDGTVYCDGKFPDSWTPRSLSVTDAHDMCVDARNDESRQRWVVTGIGAAAGAAVYGMFCYSTGGRRWE